MFINKKVRMLIVLLIASFIITIFNIGYGKYIEARQIKVSAEIAKPIIILEEGNEVVINDNNKEDEYYFKVKNFNSKGEVSDVQMNYTVEITGNKDESIIYSLYEGQTQIHLENNKTQKLKLSNKQKEEHH